LLGHLVALRQARDGCGQRISDNAALGCAAATRQAAERGRSLDQDPESGRSHPKRLLNGPGGQPTSTHHGCHRQRVVRRSTVWTGVGGR